MRRIWIGLMVFLVGCAVVEKDVEQRARHSPSGRFSAELEVSEVSPQGVEKRLILRNSRTDKMVMDYPVERHASIVWSSGEDKAVIIDSFASNQNRLIIIDLEGGGQEVVDRETAERFDSNAARLQKYSHVYFRHVRWRRKGRLVCEVEIFNPIINGVPANASVPLEIQFPNGK